QVFHAQGGVVAEPGGPGAAEPVGGGDADRLGGVDQPLLHLAAELPGDEDLDHGDEDDRLGLADPEAAAVVQIADVRVRDGAERLEERVDHGRRPPFLPCACEAAPAVLTGEPPQPTRASPAGGTGRGRSGGRPSSRAVRGGGEGSRSGRAGRRALTRAPGASEKGAGPEGRRRGPPPEAGGPPEAGERRGPSRGPRR